MTDPVVLVVFALVYAGMFLGRLPGLALDRTGVALVGAIALVATGRLGVEEAWRAMDAPTLLLLFGLMVVSAQLRVGGFYARAARKLGEAAIPPQALLALLVGGAALLSAVLANDVICLAAAPVLVEVCDRRGLSPVPFLVGLACAANVGSAATLIGNPQNVLIGERLGLDFAQYLGLAAPPVLLGLVVTWLLLCRLSRGRWYRPGRGVAAQGVPFDAWQTGKGAVVVVALMALFLLGIGEREVLALGAAGLLLLSRRVASRTTLALVDWPLLLLFVGLFVVHAALERAGAVERGLAALDEAGIDVGRPSWLFGLAAGLSNLVSNVPAVMLLLPAASGPADGAALAIASTLAGNLLLVGSIANLIVVDQAERLGVRVSWREHARYGVPVTLATLAVAAAWLALAPRTP